MSRRAVIFANGELRNIQSVRSMVLPTDTLIAADGGLHHILSMGLRPDLLIGDLDSISSDLLENARTDNVEIRQYPIEKNKTDLELALLAAVDMGFEEIIITAALGGRIDQELANIALLSHPALEDRSVRISDGIEDVFMLSSGREVSGEIGDVVSLLPVTEVVTGISTAGLKYALDNETLKRAESRGVSNVMIMDTFRVNFTNGKILCVHTRGIGKGPK